MKALKRLCVLTLVAALPFFCGCRMLLSFDIPTYDGPQATAAPAPTEAPAFSADENMNPVSAVYYGYYDDVQYPSGLFAYHLEQDASFAASDSLVYFSAHEMYVSEGLVTFGWLLSTDGEDYSSSVTGAATGTGRIAPNRTVTPTDPDESDSAKAVEEHGGYVLNFYYDDGRSISGLLGEDGALSFTTAAPEGDCSVTLARADDGAWESSVERNGMKSILRLGDDLEFVLMDVSGEASPLTLYHWTDDQVSAKRIDN